jgi:methylase of polypeptide subunit release factors
MGATQAPQMMAYCEQQNKWREIRIIKDYSGHDRVLRAIRETDL